MPTIVFEDRQGVDLFTYLAPANGCARAGLSGNGYSIGRGLEVSFITSRSSIKIYIPANILTRRRRVSPD